MIASNIAATKSQFSRLIESAMVPEVFLLSGAESAAVHSLTTAGADLVTVAGWFAKT